MNRWDIINKLIEKVKGEKYLEIGYYKGWSFEAVRCARKIAVDPNPSREPWMESDAFPYNTEKHFYTSHEENATIIKTTSDEFFTYQEEHPETYEGKYDVIFIDGLHEWNQVRRDILNSRKHLKPGGYIVLHDMNPPQEEHTKGGIDGCWTGDCYKAMMSLRGELHANYITVDTDWGVGIIRPYTTFPSGEFSELNWFQPIKNFYDLDYKKAMEDWNYFDQNRKELLNIISVDEFNKI